MAITVSVMTGGVNNHPTTSEEANGFVTDFVSEGVIGSITNTGGVAPATGAFAVNAQGPPNMTVAVSSGVAYVAGTPTSQNSQTFRVYNSASSNVTIAANSSGSTKYDWVYIRLDATLLNAPTLAGDTTATLVTSRSTSSAADNGTPPTYGYPIAVVTVSNGASSITNANIRDVRAYANSLQELPYITYTPTWTNLTVGNGTVTARYTRVGKTVIGNVCLVFGSTTSITGAFPTLTLPVTSATTPLAGMANSDYLDNGTTRYFGWGPITSAVSSIACAVIGTAGANAIESGVSSTVPFTWTTNDRINISFRYEVA